MPFPTNSWRKSGLSQQEQQHNGPFSKGPLCRDKKYRVTAVLVTFSIDALGDVGLSSNFKLIYQHFLHVGMNIGPDGGVSCSEMQQFNNIFSCPEQL